MHEYNKGSVQRVETILSQKWLVRGTPSREGDSPRD